MTDLTTTNSRTSSDGAKDRVAWWRLSVRTLRHGALVAGATLAACSPQVAEPAPAPAPALAAAPANVPAARPALHPISELPVIPLTITATDGEAHAFAVELARTAQEQARGLMFRERMGADEGMIFPNDPPQTRTFWMHNTILPLDLIFIGPDHRIVNIAANAVPYSEDLIPSAAPVIAVLELNGGRAAQLGITPGARVEW